jgi:hypothetical protein
MCAALIFVHATLLVIAALENSATFDEPAHLAAGVEYWRHGDFSVYSLTPPLLRLWAALPAVVAGAAAPDPGHAESQPLRQRHWIYAFEFLAANGTRFETLLKLARLGMIPLSCLGAWIVYRWAFELYGPTAGMAACAMYCFNPSVLAHGSLVTVDAGTTAAMLASSYLWWRFCRIPKPTTWLLACFAVTCAELCKYTAVLLGPMLLSITISSGFIVPGNKAWRRWAALIALFVGVLVLLNAAYGFHGALRPLREFQFDSDLMRTVRQKLPFLPSPAPRLFVEGFDAQKRDSQGAGYQGFLFGQMYFGARWFYYPLALLCKLPLSMIMLIAIAAFSPWVNLRESLKENRGELGLLSALAVFAGAVIFLGDLNIGTRYLLPGFPLAIILISRLWRNRPIGEFAKMQNTPRKLTRLRNVLLALLAVETMLVCPWFLSFINVAAGGSASGWRLLSDSDFDWGQGLIALRRWMHANRQPSITQAYFGLVDPAIYSIQSTPITGEGKGPFVAVSSYYLNGLENRLVIQGSRRAIIRLPYAAALRRRRPVAVIAGTLFIYSRRDVEAAALESLPAIPPASSGF